MKQPILRTATLDDLETITSLMRQFYEHEQYPFCPDRARRALTVLLTQISQGFIWLIEEAQPIGYLIVAYGFSCEFGGRFALLDEFYLEDALRGQGIGSFALQALITHCQALGLRALRLEVETKNTRAKQLYQRHGFLQERCLMTSLLSEGADQTHPLLTSTAGGRHQ